VSGLQDSSAEGYVSGLQDASAEGYVSGLQDAAAEDYVSGLQDACWFNFLHCSPSLKRSCRTLYKDINNVTALCFPNYISENTSLVQQFFSSSPNPPEISNPKLDSQFAITAVADFPSYT